MEPKDAVEKDAILIVDDTVANVDVLVECLGDRYDLTVAMNGPDALTMVEDSPPDLILLDIMMPMMDGYEVCQRLKESALTKEIPVIFITAMTDEHDEAKGLALGAVDYITKPISPAIVQARVKTHLALRHSMQQLQKAYAIIEARKNRMEEELNVGRDIQMSLVPSTFPPFVEHPELDIHAILHPAREVGGDFYDYFFVDENHLCFCIGDVSGKGVPAALFMSMAKTLIQSHAMERLSTGEIMTRVNRDLSRDNEAVMFVTLFVGILNVRNGNLVYSNGGHNAPCLIRDGNHVLWMENRHGPLVGPIEGARFGEDALQLKKGDMLFLYTDGVTEAMNADEELFGEERLFSHLCFGVYPNAESLTLNTFNRVKEFEGGTRQTDDITILAVRYLGG